jgi:hypothetical protein
MPAGLGPWVLSGAEARGAAAEAPQALAGDRQRGVRALGVGVPSL